MANNLLVVVVQIIIINCCQWKLVAISIKLCRLPRWRRRWWRANFCSVHSKCRSNSISTTTTTSRTGNKRSARVENWQNWQPYANPLVKKLIEINWQSLLTREYRIVCGNKIYLKRDAERSRPVDKLGSGTTVKGRDRQPATAVAGIRPRLSAHMNTSVKGQTSVLYV